jgi:putative thioredoxin
LTSSNYILDVNESTFETDVVLYSDTSPVFVDFWAEWNQASNALSAMLEHLAHEAGGAFRLAHVDADQNPNLVLSLNVRSLPTVKVFHQGAIVAEFTGAQPEALVRQFIARVDPVESDLNIEKGNHLILEGDWHGAEVAFREALALRPDDGAGLLGLAKSHLAQGRPADALVILREFPASKQYPHAELLVPLADVMAREMNDLIDDDDEILSIYSRAFNLVGLGNLEAAADGFLDVLRHDKKYANGTARKCMLAVLELLGADHPEERAYRNELNAILF